MCSEALNLLLSLETSILDPSILMFIKFAGFIIQYVRNWYNLNVGLMES